MEKFNKLKLKLLLFIAFFSIIGSSCEESDGGPWGSFFVHNNSNRQAILIGYDYKDPSAVSFKYTIEPNQFFLAFYASLIGDVGDILDVSKLEVYAGSDLRYTAYPDQDDPIFDDFSYTEVYRDDEQVISILPLFK